MKKVFMWIIVVLVVIFLGMYLFTGNGSEVADDHTHTGEEGDDHAHDEETGEAVAADEPTLESEDEVLDEIDETLELLG